MDDILRIMTPPRERGNADLEKKQTMPHTASSCRMLETRELSPRHIVYECV